MKTRFVFLLAVTVRVLIALSTQTFFQPDEFFQSLEVAHSFVFGYGHLTWEWLSEHPIRSILYPAINAPIYYVLKTTDLDETRLLIWGPKILHGVLASFTDTWICELTRQTTGERYVKTALLLSLTSLFHGLSLSRSMSNSLETSLTTIALSYFPWDTQARPWRSQFRTSLATAALACAVRPTNAVLWVFLVALLAWQHRGNLVFLSKLVADITIIGVLTVGALCYIDSLYYGRLTFTPLNFVLTNLSSVSLFYGSSAWHYYLTQGFPILCTTALPFTCHGMWLLASAHDTRAGKSLVALVMWTVVVYSLAGHKEWRFIHPLLPVLHVFAARSIVDLYHRNPTEAASQPRRTAKPYIHISTRHLTLLLLNIPPLLYLMFFHGRAQIEVMHYLRSLREEDTQSVGFLMPCHSTPWQAYLHKSSWTDGRRFWSLGCEPPLGGQAIGDYKDQTDVFYASPIAYLQERFPPTLNLSFPSSPRPYTPPGEPLNVTLSHTYGWQHTWPQYLVVFGALLREPGMEDLLKGKGYVEVWRKEYGWEGDERRRGGVIVMKV